jgi:hypothetical protein
VATTPSAAPFATPTAPPDRDLLESLEAAVERLRREEFSALLDLDFARARRKARKRATLQANLCALRLARLRSLA